MSIEREGGRDYCATFTFLQRDTGKMDDERSGGEEGGREGAKESRGQFDSISADFLTEFSCRNCP